jgi:hypothetical protein
VAGGEDGSSDSGWCGWALARDDHNLLYDCADRSNVRVRCRLAYLARDRRLLLNSIYGLDYWVAGELIPRQREKGIEDLASLPRRKGLGLEIRQALVKVTKPLR